jgi:cell fate regulator YaaT (PSP1 superfamily)
MAKAAGVKSKQEKHKKYMLVRYGQMHNLGIFEHNESSIPKTAARVVVKTAKGLELGCIVGHFSHYKSGQFRMDNKQIKKYYQDSMIDFDTEASGRFIRYATADDIGEERHLQRIAKEELKFCKQLVKEMSLPMDVIDVEHIFGGDGRVDFRELVKKLAHEYQSRIEMRQIGSRDEAKLLGDIETCGQECCCIKFLQALKPVNMRMAKMQKATLDPSKISGYCGRLKCCLRYEDATYIELKKRLPKKRAKVKTQYGVGKVLDVQILTQLVMVELESGQQAAVGVEEIEVLEAPPARKRQQADEEQDIKDENGGDDDMEEGEIEADESDDIDTEDDEGEAENNNEEQENY